TSAVRGAPTGARIELAQGQARSFAPAAAPAGTTVEVRELFAAVPARRKFLRSPRTELAHLTELLQRMALARPEVGFRLTDASREALRYPAVARPGERLVQVLGRSRAAAMAPVEHADAGVAVRGWVSRAGESYAQARGLLTYVNGRLVRDRLVTRAVLDGYRALLPQGRYPAAVLFVELDGEAVDVNVHPAKLEVRFAAGDVVHRVIRHAVAAALDAAASGPSIARNRPEPDEVAVGAGSGSVAEALERYAARTQPIAASPGAAAAAGRLGLPPAPRGRSVADAPSTAADTDRAEPSPRVRFAELRVVGQALAGYIVCDAGDSLVLIDQHAAHERVRFERLRAGGRGAGAASQRLLEPRVVELDAPSLDRLAPLCGELAAAGFEVEPFGERSVVVRAIPAALDVTTDAATLLADLAADLAALGVSERLAAARDTLFARIACHGAVRAGDPLVGEEMTRLVRDLDTIPFAATCPHGRPLLVELSRGELARRVRRT
ncbi:MAG TPA: DNA mismatch repair endonuclease MutL, partial [Candidatus Bathyarchaeia archaeon]|nr:DNA mismatch repair endonuclease MutL [Candidatus Bathyarchaeia archaeon]